MILRVNILVSFIAIIFILSSLLSLCVTSSHQIINTIPGLKFCSSLLARFAYAQDQPSTNTSPHRLTYQNLTAGFKIEYPLYWQKSENITSNSSIVYFIEPLSGVRFMVANFKIPQINLLNEPKSLILSTYLNGFTQPFQPYNSTQSTSTTLVGNPANKTELTYITAGYPSRGMILSSIIGDKVYILSYAGSKANYALFLPTIQEMIDSFQLINTPSTTSSSAFSHNHK